MALSADDAKRVKTLNSFAGKISRFLMEETFTDEKALHTELTAAVTHLDAAVKLIESIAATPAETSTP